MRVTSYQLGNAEISVYRPDLTEEERLSRERTLRTALQQVGKMWIEQSRGRYENDYNNTTRDIGEKQVLDR